MKRSRWALAAVAAWTLAAAADPAAFTLQHVLERIRPADGHFASAYRQTRASTLLTNPVTTHGRIAFTAPDRLRKVEIAADGSRRVVTIDNNTVTVRSNDGNDAFPLARAPMLAFMVRTLTSLAAADGRTLRDRYDARLEGDWAHWQIKLDTGSPDSSGKPGTIAGQATHASLDLAGHAGRVDAIELDSAATGRIRIRLLDRDAGK